MKSSEVERPPVTLVVPNYNGKNLLAKNLPEVLKAAAHYPVQLRESAAELRPRSRFGL